MCIRDRYRLSAGAKAPTQESKEEPQMKTKIFLSLVISCLLLVSTDAHAKLLVWTNGFEGLQANDWWFAGNANIDVNAGLARTGQNNGWAHNWQGWNAVNT